MLYTIYTNKCSYLTRNSGTIREEVHGMTEFEYDCLKKKQVARSARRRVGLRKRVTLPSDHLSTSQLAARNGPCRVYRMGRPMTIRQFEAMPRDLQQAYLQRLRQRGGSEAAVGRMLGVGRQRLRQLQTQHRVCFDRPDAVAWSRFLGEEA